MLKGDFFSSRARSAYRRSFIFTEAKPPPPHPHAARRTLVAYETMRTGLVPQPGESED
jgi:hypothetical protein